MFRDKKADFETTYILKKQMKSLYPAGGYTVVGQVGKGDEEIGVLVSNEQEEKVYKHSIFKPEMKKPNFVLSIAVNVIRIFAVLVLVAGLMFPLLVRYPATVKDTVVNALLLSIANLPKMLLVTAMNILPALLLIVLPQVFFFLSFLLPVCGFALIGLYDLNVTDKIFAKLESPQTDES